MSKRKAPFPYLWNMADGYPAKGIQYHGHTVFGTFVCGGGSTMGYKLAGYNHLGGVEIDENLAEVYKENHKPKHIYIEDIRKFNKRRDLPKELFNLSFLDGSPPCSSFSLAGKREKDWNKKKKFKEGQKHQRLDDLVFEYVKTIKKLQPKVALLENVDGLIKGNAKAYAKKIFHQFTKAGYQVQLFVLNAATMGVPQRRKRVFFIGLRNDINLPKLKLNFNERIIIMDEIIDKNTTKCDLTDYQKECWDHRIKSDTSFGDIIMRRERRLSMFSNPIIHSDVVSPTLTSQARVNALYDIPRGLTLEESKKIASFPQDYKGTKGKVNWMIGMSVPPVMTAQIANQIFIQWLSKI